VAEQDCDKTGGREQISVWIMRFRDWLARKLGRWLKPGVLLVALAAAVATACQSLKSQGVASEDAWKGWEPLNIILLVSLVIAGVGAVLSLWGYARMLKKEDENDELGEVCKGVWHIALKELKITHDNMEKVAVHVWTIRGIKGARRLERRATFTLKNRRWTRIMWRKGKGAIGTAWAKRKPVLANVENLDRRTSSLEDFCALPVDTRYGLGWAEFQRAKHYKAILAVPLEASGGVAGCLSVDVQLDGCADGLDTLAGSDQFTNALTVCEALLA
jgi:hypothetical protein